MFNVWLGHTRSEMLVLFVCWLSSFSAQKKTIAFEMCACKRMKNNNKSEHEKLANGELVRVLLTGF